MNQNAQYEIIMLLYKMVYPTKFWDYLKFTLLILSGLWFFNFNILHWFCIDIINDFYLYCNDFISYIKNIDNQSPASIDTNTNYQVN